MDGPRALDLALEARRLEIRKRWNAIAAAMDPRMSVQHLNKIRKGKVPLNEFTAAGIDKAVGWPIGESWRIYEGHGGFPKEGKPGPDDDPSVEPPEPLRDDIERRIWSTPLVPRDLLWKAILRHREQQKRDATG